MSSPPATPSKTTDPNMGLSATEIRILLLGIVHSAEGKVDHEKLAAKTGYTIGSSRTVYNAARRKLQKLHGDEGHTGDGSPAQKPRKLAGGRKKKQKVTHSSTEEVAADEATTSTKDEPAASPTEPDF